MADDTEIWQQIAKRERLSRKEAERLLDEKALELYAKTENIERTKAEVEALNNLLLNVMESSPDGIVTCSQDLIIQAINVTAERQLGYRPSDLVGKSIDYILPNFKRTLANTRGSAFKFDCLEARDARGGTFSAEVRGTRDGKDVQTHFVMFIHDISKEVQAKKEIKVREQQIDEARRLEAIGALSAGIAHEINTPIQFIGDNMGFLRESLAKIHKSYSLYENLRQQAASIPALTDFAAHVASYNQGIRIDATVADIYDCVEESVGGIEQVRDIVLLMKEFAHPGTGNEEFTNLNEIIEGLIKITHNKYRGIATINQNLSVDLPSIQCRRGQIQQVLLNLMVNAVDAIEEKGLTPGVIELSTTFDAHYVHIMIADTGGGVPQSLKDKIFDPFFTTKPVGKGTGQGLALAKDFIVAGHNGRLEFVDMPGFSTTFKISLPREQRGHLTQEHQHAA